MNNKTECIQKYHLSIQKIESHSSYMILYGKEKNYLLKNKGSSKKELYNLFETIHYNNYLPLISDDNDSYELYPYYKEIIRDNSIKGEKIIDSLLLLHSKTMSQVELDDATKKNIYEIIKKEIDEKETYYEQLQYYIENFSFPRIDYYYLLNNISLFYKSIWNSKDRLEKWFQLKNNIMYKAYVLHNVSLDNYKISDINYFIDYNECYIDYRIYDLVNFYKEDVLNISMPSLLKEYMNNSQWTESECLLFNCLICIPSKITFTNSAYNNTIQIKNELDKIDKTFHFLSEKDEEKEKTNEEKFEE